MVGQRVSNNFKLNVLLVLKEVGLIEEIDFKKLEFTESYKDEFAKLYEEAPSYQAEIVEL
jgi:hypothetical protein